MTETAAASAPAAEPGLLSRVIGVLFSPRETYAAVAARPRALGAMTIAAALMIVCQVWFMSTPTGRDIMLDQQVRTMESFGMTVTDEMYSQIESRMERAIFTGPLVTLIYIPLANAIVAGILLAVFTMLLGGNATFKHNYSILAHSTIIIALQQLFTVPLSLASGQAAGANLGVFVPMLDENNVVTLFLGAIDLFFVWWFVSLAIGLGVLYKRRTGPIAFGLLTVYGLIALVLAVVRSGS